MKKQLQQWTMLFKLFSQTTLTPSSYIARRHHHHRLFCSATTPTPTSTSTTTNTTLFAAEHVLKQQQQQQKLPLLIVPYDHKIGDADGYSVCDGTLALISLFDFEKNKSEEVHKLLHLPEIANRRICGSSEGWLVTVHENGEIQLLNPFSRVLVHLPPLTSFPEVLNKLAAGKENSEEFFYFVNEDISGFFKQNLDFPGVVVVDSSPHHPVFKGYDSHLFRERFFEKVVTNTPTTTTDDHANSTLLPTVVMAIYGVEARRLAFCRLSDKQKRWMGCLRGDRGFYDDVTYHKGNFYAVDGYGGVVVVKGLDGGPSSSPFVETIIEGGEDKHSYKNYLVESSSSSSGGCGGGGDLLKVMRRVETKYKEDGRMYRPMGFNTIGFSVMKLNFNGVGPASLVEVTNLGEDCALFIGYNHSFSFSASKIPGCKGNCIYFTHNHLSQFYNYGGHDMGVYNLEDGSFEKLNYETTTSSSSSSQSQIFMPPPLWYVPN